MILITSQSPAAFAGNGGWEDKDNDGFSTFQGDCDDNDPEVYPGRDCEPIDFLDYITDETLDLIEEEELTESEARGLILALQRAIDDIESGKLHAAEGVLNSFLGKLDSLVNKGAISAEDAQPIIDQVQMLIDTM
jgi:hypothetical protein